MKNIDEIRKELKNELITLRKYEDATNKIDDEWSENPEDENLERAWDAAYQIESDQFRKCVTILAGFIGIDTPTAETMIRAQRERIEAII